MIGKALRRLRRTFTYLMHDSDGQGTLTDQGHASVALK